MEILKATLQDIDGIVRLNAVVQALHTENQPGFFRPYDEVAVREFMCKVFHDPASTFLVAVEDGQVVGYVLLRIQEKEGNAFAFPRHYAELDQIAVAPEFRQRGIGAALVGEAIEVAKGLGVPRVELTVWQFNEKAQRRFRNSGLEPIWQRMAVDLKESENSGEAGHEPTKSGCRSRIDTK